MKVEKMRQFAGVVTVFLLMGVASPSPAQVSPGLGRDPQEQWKRLIAAAKEEGQLNLMAGGSATRNMRPIAKIFEKRFGIKVRLSTGSSRDNVSRVLAERRVGRYTEDVTLMGARSGERMIALDVLEPIQPLLSHPEVTDKSLWYKGRYWWGDLPQKYQFTFAAAVSVPPVSMEYNTKRLDPGRIKSMWDIFRDDWKLVVGPPTHPSGQTSYFQAYIHPEMGPKWVKKLLLSKNVTFMEDPRTAVDALARGRFHLSVLGVNTSVEVELVENEKLGLPIARLRKSLKEAGFLTGTGSSRNIAVVKNQPNPNAARLFLNWFLSKEGAVALHNHSVTTPSMTLRDDVTDLGKTRPEERRKIGKDYPFPSNNPELIARIAPVRQEIIKIYRSRSR